MRPLYLARLSTVLAAGLLASCAVGPDYARPQMGAVADQWLEPASTAPVDSAWWQQFGDPELTALIERALASSPDLDQATARVAEARALREAAQGGRMPQASAAASGTLNRISENGQFPVANIPGFDPEFPLIDTGFDASWEIDLWGKASRQVEKARALEAAAEWARRDTLVSLTAEIARNYVEFRLAQANLASANTELDASRKLAELADLLHAAGETATSEADQAAVDLNTREVAVRQAQADVSSAAYRLAALVGEPPSAVVPDLLSSTRAIPGPPNEIASGIRSELLERRPDIRRAELELAASTAAIGVAKADLYPRLSLIGNIGLQAQSVDDLASGESLRYTVGPTFSWPIFSFGRIRAQVRAADARADGAAAAYESAVMKALSESEAAANRFAASVASIAPVRTALGRQQNANRLAQMLFEKGETSNLAAQQARLRLSGVERQAAQARATRAIAAIALYKALGGGWQGAEQVAKAE